jgi:hypothetical protein
MSKTQLINVLALGAISLGLVACEQKEEVEQPRQEVIEIPITVEEPKEEVKEEVEEVEEVEVKQEVKMNEPIIIKNSGEDAVKITITEVRFTDDRNEFYDGAPVENVVVIKAEVENISNEEQTVWASEIFTLYDMDGNKLDTYPNSDYQFQDYASINPTRKATIEKGFGIRQGADFELEVVEDMWDGGVIGSLFFKGTEPVETENVVEPEKGEPVKEDEPKEEVEESDEVVLTSPFTFEQYIGYFCENTQQAFEEYLALVFNSSIDGKTYKMVTSDNVLLWSATNGESGESWLEGEEFSEQDIEVIDKVRKAISNIE